jgi:hypothetical protein
MPIELRTRIPRRAQHLLVGVALLGFLVSFLPTSAGATVTTFGSPLSVPATLNTAENLNYKGTDTAVPPSREAPNGNVHTYHYGADGALWNVALASGTPTAPAGGQVLKVALEGCAQPAPGGPPPLTQIHFQVLSPLPGGGAKVDVSSQAFDIPVCGEGGAGGSTVTAYQPTNMCVSQGDYVDLNEEGGFVEHSYQSGVPYQVLGAVNGSMFDSFIKGDGGTGNGSTFSSSYTSNMDGFAANGNAELMLQATLGTGEDATPLCPGGTQGKKQAAALAAARPAVTIIRQTDGVNHGRVVAVAIYCRLKTPCRGIATLTAVGRQARQARYGRTSFSLPGAKTAHVRIHVSQQILTLLRKHRRGVAATLTAVVDGKTVSQTILLKIF